MNIFFFDFFKFFNELLICNTFIRCNKITYVCICMYTCRHTKSWNFKRNQSSLNCLKFVGNFKTKISGMIHKVRRPYADQIAPVRTKYRRCVYLSLFVDFEYTVLSKNNVVRTLLKRCWRRSTTIQICSKIL